MIASLVHELQVQLKPDRARPTFGFARLQQLTDGEWADPTAFLERHATVRVINGDRFSSVLSYRQWQQLTKQVPNRLPDDAVAQLLSCNLYNQPHLRRSFAKDFGTLVHNRLLISTVGSAGDGWERVRDGDGTITTIQPIGLKLVQHTFEPVHRPQIPRAVCATIAPPSGRRNPLEDCAARVANAISSGLKRVNLTLVAAEVEAVLPKPTFVTCPGQRARFLAPRLDAIAVDQRSGKLLVVDYKTTMGAKPAVWPGYVAQLVIGAYCLAKSTRRTPKSCLLIIATRDSTTHFFEFPFESAFTDPYIQGILKSAIIDTTARPPVGRVTAFDGTNGK
jgi:hypothetical protein